MTSSTTKGDHCGKYENLHRDASEGPRKGSGRRAQGSAVESEPDLGQLGCKSRGDGKGPRRKGRKQSAKGRKPNSAASGSQANLSTSALDQVIQREVTDAIDSWRDRQGVPSPSVVLGRLPGAVRAALAKGLRECIQATERRAA